MSDKKEIKKDATIKFSAITAPHFQMAIQKMSQVELPMRTAYWLKRSIDKISKHLEDFEKLRIERLKKFAKLDDKGELVTIDGKADFKSLEDNEAFEKEIAELREQEIDVIKLSAEMITDCDAKVETSVLVSLDAILF